ncbi:TetR/AcrR family transcriptional regulator [Brevundimonas sp. GCM10030266]|uniref:TetR/AcrR family transcriptional regulator n=1 Tax=Brevundimonas sp. GCM10030266 TaxID=3273386 RepID=UPI0036231661
MRVTREQMQANRIRILDAAGRLFREKGFEAVSVAEVMKAAGLTHGGFYGHFESKDDLIAQAIAHIFSGDPQGPEDLAGMLDAYLAPQHRDRVAQGCPTAALVADVRRQKPAARLAMTAGFKAQVDRIALAMAKTEPVQARRAAIGAWTSMVGALVLARTIDDAALSDEILRETRNWLRDATDSVREGDDALVASPARVRR